MLRFWITPALLFCVLAAVALTGSARAEDVARVMPADTALYVGWSQWVNKDAPELRLSQQYMKAARSAIADKAGEEQAAVLAKLLDVLPVLQTASVGLGLFDVTLVEHEPDIQAALVVDAGSDATRLAQTLHDAATQAGEVEIEQHSIQGVAFERVHLGNSPLSVVWGVHEHRFILALGDTAVGKVIDCIGGKAPNLADADELKFDREKIKARVDGRFLCVYGNVQRIIQRGKAIAEELTGGLPETVDPALNELGLTALRSKYVHIDEVDGQPRVAAFAHVDGPMKGLLKLWDQKPLTDEDLKIIPKDAYWAELTNVDLAGLWKEALRIIEALAPDRVPAVEGVLAMPTTMLGFSITDDLLPAFGDTWAIFDAPEHGGILLSGTVLVVDVNDPNNVQGMLQRVMELVTPLVKQKDVVLQVKQMQHGGHTIHYVLAGGAPVPVAPAWGMVGNRLVLGLYPQTVATALKQVDPQTRGESLLDQPDFKAARAKLPPDAQSVGYFDSRYFARMFYPFVTAFGTMGLSMLGKYGADIDLSVMPPLPEFVAKVTNYVGTTSKDKDGILYASVGSGAQPVMLAAGGTAMATSILLPSLARAREVSKRAVSSANLRGIGQACLMYAKDHQEKFPPSFDALLKDGMIAQAQLRSPRDPDEDEDAVSYVYIAGQTATSAAQNVVAYEKLFGDEGTNVLFLDGHVQWTTTDDFRREVRETYERLGRADELPPSFRE